MIAYKDSTMIYLSKKPYYPAILMTRHEKGEWIGPVVINDQLDKSPGMDFYTVQFTATRKPSDKQKYKNLKMYGLN